MRRRFNFSKFSKNRFKGLLLWFYPGLGIKRWVLFSTFGIFLLIVGVANFQSEKFIFIKILNLIVFSCGVIILILGIIRLLRSFLNLFLPHADKNLADIMIQKRQLLRGPRIVAIGGGTGLSVLLEGLKKYTSNITAIVTVADSGGSSGRLRREFDILPPGDIRNCLVALADAPALMRDLFQFRFNKTSELEGHSFGNLFITVMTQLTGDFERAIRESSKVLAIRGQVIPSTLNKIVLVARYKDGSIVEGEDQIPKKRYPIETVYLKCMDSQHINATTEAIKAINEAEVIVLGPGSLYTSIIPNLLVKEITNAVVLSSAMKVYVCNIMTQYGETDNYTASDHLKAIVKHSHPKLIDCCIINKSDIPEWLLKRYREDNSFPVVADTDKIRALRYRVIEEDVTSVGEFIRHDSDKLARLILGLIEEF
ncbi:MAG: YvcK family protein [Candidatus Omnitrophica bacterium]|nr:YvcK family protein [Candidatus Omnitrophota bacterium]